MQSGRPLRVRAVLLPACRRRHLRPRRLGGAVRRDVHERPARAPARNGGPGVCVGSPRQAGVCVYCPAMLTPTRWFMFVFCCVVGGGGGGGGGIGVGVGGGGDVLWVWQEGSRTSTE